MIILNFAHPLSDEQIAQAQALAGEDIEAVIDVPSQVDAGQPLAPQVAHMVDGLGIDAQRWQREVWLVNPPALNFSAVVLMAELHGRLGYFPPCLRLRPVPDALVPRFEVAEVLNLQRLREAARLRRGAGVD